MDSLLSCFVTLFNPLSLKHLQLILKTSYLRKKETAESLDPWKEDVKKKGVAQ